MNREMLYACDYCGEEIEGDVYSGDEGCEFCSADCREGYVSLQEHYKKQS